MKKDTKRPNGTIKRVQLTFAPKKGISSMGSKFLKGDVILHLSSSRCTGETFVLTLSEVKKVRRSKPSRWHRPVDWFKEIRAEADKEFAEAIAHGQF